MKIITVSFTSSLPYDRFKRPVETLLLMLCFLLQFAVGYPSRFPYPAANSMTSKLVMLAS